MRLMVDHAHPNSPPVFLSPALPSDLLQFVINHCTYPTTLIVCGDRSEYLASLAHDLLTQQQQQQQQHEKEPHTADKPHGTTVQEDTAADRPPQAKSHAHHPKPRSTNFRSISHPLVACNLAQLATTRHIRTIFVPTVSHLRAFLSVFSVNQSSSGAGKALVPPIPPPLVPPSAMALKGRPLLVAYNFLALHRGTSEWSVQGLGASGAALVEAGRREGLGVVVVEGLLANRVGGKVAEKRVGNYPNDCDDDAGSQKEIPSSGLKGLLEEKVPVLSGGAKRVARELDGRGGWTGKTADVGRVLGRWFRFRDGEWTAGG
ncbi:hypothetical protein VTI28DRAFT_7442 [Corynascus sepedonium]